MNRRRLYSPANESQTDINLSPLIDVVFILLIFFVVTTVFVEETGVELSKPKALFASPLDKGSIQIAITSSGEVIFGARNIGTSGVRPLIRRLLRTEQRPVIIQADRSVPAHLLVKVIDEAQAAGVTSVSVSTETP